MNNRKRIIRLAAVALCLLCFLALPIVAEERQVSPLSPALEVLAEETDISLWHLAGETQSFSEECFLRGLNLSHLSSVRVTELPNPAEGILRLGKGSLQTGALLDASELSRLTFEATSEKVKNASFRFEVNECGLDYTCRIYALDVQNASPELDGIPALYRKNETHKNLPLTGKLYAVDPEGDRIIFEIATPPKYGSIAILGDHYTYLPFGDYIGEDSFSYVARDVYGNYSAALRVSLSVSAISENLAFADLSDPETQNAVLTLASAGIFGGTKLGSEVYFYPDREMTRAEFLVLAMSASGIGDLPVCEDTGFFDDAEIPSAMKPYVATAYRLGYLGGQVKGGEVCFLPNDAITYGDAALLVSNILLLDCSKSVASVSGATGDEKALSVAALAEVGVIEIKETDPLDRLLTRAEAAKLIAGVFSLCR